jgi:hypothetical protein
MSIYDPLYQFLCRATQTAIRMTFEQLEGVLGFALPKTAKQRQQWWGNETAAETSHVQCRFVAKSWIPRSSESYRSNSDIFQSIRIKKAQTRLWAFSISPNWLRCRNQF